MEENVLEKKDEIQKKLPTGKKDGKITEDRLQILTKKEHST